MKDINIVKTRILIFETLMPAYNALLDSINTERYEIVAVVDNESSITYTHSFPIISFPQIIDFSFWDLLIINDKGFKNDISKILSALNIPEERYFFLHKSIGWDEVSFYRGFFKENTRNGKVWDFTYIKLAQNYFAVTTKGGEYITHASDNTISQDMFLTGKTYSQDEIDQFITLTEQYYGTMRDERGFFFDIGANIGTTCIYAKKYLVPNMTVVAFEPLYKNFKLLHANMILNDITDYMAVNKAVSDSSGSYDMVFDTENPGGSSIVLAGTGKDVSNVQSVDSISIDEFIMQNHIEPADVRYVWIDTEGFEANVLKGAKILLEQEKTAFYFEYSPSITDAGRLMVIADICAQYFQKFISMDDFFAGDTNPRPIKELYELHKRYPNMTNIFLIK